MIPGIEQYMDHVWVSVTFVNNYDIKLVTFLFIYFWNQLKKV